MRIIDRFSKYMEISNLNDNQVTENCSLSVGLLGKARKGESDLGKKAVEKILSFYQNINRVWLLTGEGEMLKNQSPEQKNKNNAGVTLQAGGDIRNSPVTVQSSDFIDLLKKKDEQIDRLLTLLESK